MTEKMDLLGRLELQVVRDPSTGVRKVVFRNQRGQLLNPADNPELMATFIAGGITQADLSSALATKANASSLAAKADTTAVTTAIANAVAPKADTTAVTAAISTQHTVDNGTYASLNPQVSSYTYNGDGTVATETVAGITTTYTYNADGTVATSARSGVTRTYTYNTDGTLASVS